MSQLSPDQEDEKMLSSAEIEAYGRDGVLFPIPALSAEEAAAYRRAFEATASESGPAVRQPHLSRRWAYDLATHPRVLDAVEDVLGPDVLAQSTLVFHKRAGDGGFVSWHQDSLYGSLRTRLVTAWIALAPSRAENGCMRVVPGSHRGGIREHQETPSAGNILPQGQTIEDVDESRAVDIVLAPGEMSLHDGDIVHGSNASRSGPDRIGFIVRYVTPEAPPAPHPMIAARGRRDLDHLELLESPPEEDGAP